ncbi:hypothetical protein MLC59_10540 [Marinobacter bryozoorum]|nr:hypothetical protein [Marinobacter bryozoorum]MCK7544605.1 hypothetical protein [Marinobacter bryozoorum]
MIDSDHLLLLVQGVPLVMQAIGSVMVPWVTNQVAPGQLPSDSLPD